MLPFADRSTSPPRYSHAPQAIALSLADLVAADGHRVSMAINGVVRLLDRPADIAVFNEQITAAKSSVALDDVRRYVAAQLRHPIDDFVAERSGDACIDDTAALQAFLLEQLNAIGFGCGLEFLAPLNVHVTSNSLAADRLAAAAARRQTAALDRAAELQQRLQASGAAYLVAVDQAELLPTLLRAAAERPATMWLAAGPHVVAIDLPSRGARSIDVDAIGALRSIRQIRLNSRPHLAVGGQHGVAVIDPTGQSPPSHFLIGAADSSSRGFNAVVFDESAGELVATHGEIGIVRWPIDSTAAPKVTPLPGARLLTQLDDRLLLASGGDVFVCTGGSLRAFPGDSSVVVGLVAWSDAIVIVRADGQFTRLDRTSLAEILTLRRPGNVRCAAQLEIAGLATLLLGTEDGTLDCITPGGQVLMQRRLRLGVSLIAAAGGTIAALSADRSSLEFVEADPAARTIETINLVARFGHRATDLA